MTPLSATICSDEIFASSTNTPDWLHISCSLLPSIVFILCVSRMAGRHTEWGRRWFFSNAKKKNGRTDQFYDRTQIKFLRIWKTKNLNEIEIIQFIFSSVSILCNCNKLRKHPFWHLYVVRHVYACMRLRWDGPDAGPKVSSVRFSISHWLR